MKSKRASKYFYQCQGCRQITHSDDPAPWCCSEECESEAKNPTAVRRRYQQSYVYRIAPEVLPRFLAIYSIFRELAHAVQGGQATLDEANELIVREYERIAKKIEEENEPHIVLWPEERF